MSLAKLTARPIFAYSFKYSGTFRYFFPFEQFCPQTFQYLQP